MPPGPDGYERDICGKAALIKEALPALLMSPSTYHVTWTLELCVTSAFPDVL